MSGLVELDGLEAAVERACVAMDSLRAENVMLLAALKVLFADYKQLADSGDAGFWKLEDKPEGQQALAAIAQAEGREVPA